MILFVEDVIKGSGCHVLIADTFAPLRQNEVSQALAQVLAITFDFKNGFEYFQLFLHIVGVILQALDFLLRLVQIIGSGHELRLYFTFELGTLLCHIGQTVAHLPHFFLKSAFVGNLPIEANLLFFLICGPLLVKLIAKLLEELS